MVELGPSDDTAVTKLIVVTDGEDTTSTRGPDDLLAVAREGKVRVFVITIRGTSCAARPLESLTADTGGACYAEVPSASALRHRDHRGLGRPEMLLWNQPRDRPYVVGVAVALFLCLGLVAWVLTVPLRTPVEPAAGELVILSGRDDSAGDQQQVRINLWNEVHPDKRARIVELSGNADQQRNEMVRLAQDPDGVVDVYNLDVTWTAEFAENDYIVPLTGVSTDASCPARSTRAATNGGSTASRSAARSCGRCRSTPMPGCSTTATAWSNGPSTGTRWWTRRAGFWGPRAGTRPSKPAGPRSWTTTRASR